MTNVNFEGIVPTDALSKIFQTSEGVSISGTTFVGFENSSAGPSYALFVVEPWYFAPYYDWGSGAVMVLGRRGNDGTVSPPSHLLATLPPLTKAIGTDLMSIDPYASSFTIIVHTSETQEVFNVQSLNYPQRAFVGFTASVPIISVDFVAQVGHTMIDNFSFAPGPEELPPPTNLTATQASANGNLIAVTWEYGSNPVDGFFIETQFPSSGANNWIPLSPLMPIGAACIPSQSSAIAWRCYYGDTAGPLFGTVSYRVRAYKGTDTSAPSNLATAYQIKKCVLRWAGFDGTPRTDCEHPSANPAGSWIQVDFRPDPGASSVRAAAHGLPPDDSEPFDHFNWIQHIEHWPQCIINDPNHEAKYLYPLPQPGRAINNIGEIDPPLNGYYEYWQRGLSLSDDLPFYWDEKSQWALAPIPLNPTEGIASFSAGDQDRGLTASFYDRPGSECITGSVDDYLEFLTYLVGVRTPVGVSPARFTVLNAFVWRSTYNRGSSGGITLAGVSDSDDAGGNGGVFSISDVDITNLPPRLKQQLEQAGAQGLSSRSYVDTNAPLTAGFIVGDRIASGLYSGPVQVSLIPTDIDGPADIASTLFSLDGAQPVGYTTPFTVFTEGTHTIQFGSADQAGNTETPLKLVTFKIDKPPTLAVPVNLIVEASGAGGAVATYAAPASDTLDGVLQPLCFPQAGATFPIGDTTVNCSVVDSVGNATTGHFVITVRDTTPPTISGHSSMTAEATGSIGAMVIYSSPATMDLVDGSGVAMCVPASGGMFPLGSTTVTCNAKDAHGNAAAPTLFNVLVKDTTSPELMLPSPLTATATTASGAIVSFATTAKDIVDGSVGVACLPASGTVFPIGTTSVSCSARDSHGNGKNGSFPVSVLVPSTAGRVDGDGHIVTSNEKQHFAFSVRRQGATQIGHFDYLMHAKQSGRKIVSHFHATRVTSVAFFNAPDSSPGKNPPSGVDQAAFAGVGTWNDQAGYTFQATALDAGEPGKGHDRFGLTIRDSHGNVVVTVNGILTDGNIQSLSPER